jgi:YD repeat-containing protein
MKTRPLAATGLSGFTDSIETRYAYDVMNRLTNVVQLTHGAATASAWYDYDSAGRLRHKGYGNGDVVTHGYDTESRLLSMGITNNTAPVLWYAYGWDKAGNILAITNNGTNVTLYGYDAAGQLTNEVVVGSATNSWVYDEAGNWLNPTPTTKWVYNADHELPGRVNNGDTNFTITVTGEVEPGPRSNKWYHSNNKLCLARKARQKKPNEKATK